MSKYLQLTEEQIESSIAMTEMSSTERVLVMDHLRELSANNPDPVREAAQAVVDSYVGWKEDRGLRDLVYVQEVDETAIDDLREALKQALEGENV